MAMSAKVEGDPAAEFGASGSQGGAAEKRPTAVGRALVAVVALGVCAAAIFWACRVMWDQGHPLLAAARGLHAGDPARRTEAVHAVKDMGFGKPSESIRLLIPAAADAEPGVRAAAVESLGILGANAMGLGIDAEDVRAAASALLGLTADPDRGVRAAVMTSLSLIGSGATSPRPEGRNPAAAKKRAAGPVVDAEAVAAALTAGLDSPDEPVRQAALAGLGAMAPRLPGAAPPGLVRALDDDSGVIRTAAAAALGRYRKGLDPAIPALLRHLEDQQPSVCAACAEAFRRIRPPAVSPASAPAVLAALRVRDHAARASLVTLIGRLGSDPGAAVPALITVLREPIDSDARIADRTDSDDAQYAGPAHEAARALSLIARGTPRAGEAMAALLAVVRSGPAQRKPSAASALGGFGPAAVSAVPDLIGLLKEAAASPVPVQIGASAADALGKIAPGTPAADEVIAALTAALRAPWIATRQAALAALPAFGPKAAPALPIIREIENRDPDSGVRKAASDALRKMKA